jgi:uncharacterized membrane protein YeaQ/YmgE (transglycosylase-associated protein family)
MSSLQRLLSRLGVGGSVMAIILIILGFFLIGPFFLIWGLKLMGFSVGFSFKSFFGAALVIFVLRPSSVSNK